MSLYQGFIGPSYVSQSPNVSRETLRNWMPQTTEVSSESASVSFNPRPGLSVYCALDQTPLRGLFSQDGSTYAVAGRSIYSIASGNVSATKLGTLSAIDSNPATMVSNGVAGNQLFVTSGEKADIVTLSTGVVTPVTAAGYPANTPMGVYLDAYFGTLQLGTQQFNISGVLDGIAWSALDFDLVTQASNNLVGLIQLNKILMAVGSRTTVPFYDSGTSPFPFLAVPQVLIEVGCMAPFSICKTSNLAAWLHRSDRGEGQFISVSGDYVPRRLSTYAVESQWLTYPTMTDCVAFTMSWQGHDLAVLTFPSGNATWVYDFTESENRRIPMWHQWTWWNALDANHDRFRGWVHCESPDGHLVGDWENGIIYLMDGSLASDNSNQIIYERTGAHINAERRMMFHSEFMIDMETGLGGTNPTASLDWSDDGGHTFGTTRLLSTGAIGQYQTRCRMAGSLGQSRDRMYRTRMWNSIPPRPFAAYLTVNPGTN